MVWRGILESSKREKDFQEKRSMVDAMGIASSGLGKGFHVPEPSRKGAACSLGATFHHIYQG